MKEERPGSSSENTPKQGIPKDASRLEMMRRHKYMTAEERIDLFERLSRRAAWARSAKRIK